MLTSIGRYALARGLPGLVNFGALALFTRLLDEHQYGLYALVVAAAGLCYALFLQWLSLAVLRLAAPNESRRGVLLGTVLSLFIPLAAGTAILLALGISSSTGWHPNLLIAAGVGFFIVHSWHDLNLNLATADQLPLRYGWLGAIRATAGLALGAAAALAGLGAAGVVAGLALGGVVSGVWAYRTGWRARREAGVDPSLRGQLIRYGLPLAGAFVLGYIISAADRLLLAALLSPAAAGMYAPAYDMTLQAIATLMIVVNLGAYPLAVAAMERGEPAERNAQFRQHALLLAAVALPAAAGLAILAPSVSGLLGPRFAPAARELLPFLALAQVLAGMKGYYFDLSFQLGHATALQLVTVLVGALVNVALNLWWIPIYGIHGSAYATVVAYFVALVVSWWLGRRVLPLPIPVGALGRVAVATLGMSVALFPVRHATGPLVLVGQILLGVLVYGSLLVLFARGNPRRVLVT